MQIETVKSRSDKYEECYAAYCQKKGWENFKPRNAEYVLLHTLSHMLIKEMSMQSGYSSSALHERIYSSENMCGILIYTGAADKEGSLGGLVELGEMNKFLPLLKGALENGLTCTTDPECFMKNPTSERLNGAACHSCMAKVMTLFVYIKLFESIVTVEGEDFLNSREEKECYKLVRESTKFIYDRLEEFSKYNCKTASDELNRHMRNMFKNMRSSLKEEVGSIKKDFL